MKAFIGILLLAILHSPAAIAKKGDGDASRTSIKAVYVVPVTPDLVSYSIFAEVSVDVVVDTAGNIKFEYSLPLELTGVENKLEYSGTPDANGKLVAESENGRASCDAVGKLTKCSLIYKNLVFDQKARQALLLRKSAGDAEAFAARTSVAATFEGLVTGSPSPIFLTNGLEIQNRTHVPDAGSEPHGILQLIY